VPFFKASLISGASTVILLFIFLIYANLGVWGLVLAQGLAQSFNNWKWPYEVCKQLKISRKNIKN
jgi:hypothetical protein